MSAVAWSIDAADPGWDPHVHVTGVARSLAERFDTEFEALAPWWIRVDPTTLVWLPAPLAVLVVALPSSLLRVAMAALVAVGVSFTLTWSKVLALHRRRRDRFVDQVASQVALQMTAELPPVIVEEVAGAQFRPGLELPILSCASRAATSMRGREPILGPLRT